MAWTAPRTWVANEIVRAAMLNEQLRDNLQHLMDSKAANSGFIIDVTHAAYGAVGDGATDDTAAIQAAINAVPSGFQSTVILPWGKTFKVSSVRLKSNVRITGGGTLSHIAGSTAPILYWPQSPRSLIENVTIEGLKFQGEVSTAAEAERSGIYIVYGKNIVVRDCEFYDFKSAAVHVQDCRRVTYDNLVAKRCSNGWNAVNSGLGRNALEVLGTAFADTTDVAAEWSITNCHVDNAGAPNGGAGGIYVVGNDAQRVRATVTGNWVYNAVNAAGIAVEAGFARLSSVTNNKVFGCHEGISAIDTVNTHGTTEVVERLILGDNVIDAKNVTTTAATPTNSGVDGTPVAAGADVPASIGIDCQASNSIVRHNLIRVVETGVKVRPSAVANATNTVVDGNVVIMAATSAGAGFFGFSISGNDLTVTSNRVRLESGANMRDAYYLATIDGITFENNSSRGAGRYAVQLLAVQNATINGGEHLDPATHGILFGDANCSDVHIGGGIVVRDDRGTPTMTYAINATSGGTRLTLGEAVLTGYTSGDITGHAYLTRPPGHTGRLARKRRTVGTLTLNSTAWTAVSGDTSLDLTVSAKVGDWIALSLAARPGTEAVGLAFDMNVMTGLGAVNRASGFAVDASDNGVGGWFAASGNGQGVGGTVLYQVQAGDLSAGQVTFRPVYRTLTATNRTLWADSFNLLEVSAQAIG